MIVTLRLQRLLTASRLFATLIFNCGCYPFLWCYHSNEISMADLFCSTIYFLRFYEKRILKLFGGSFALVSFRSIEIPLMFFKVS